LGSEEEGREKRRSEEPQKKKRGEKKKEDASPEEVRAAPRNRKVRGHGGRECEPHKQTEANKTAAQWATEQTGHRPKRKRGTQDLGPERKEVHKARPKGPRGPRQGPGGPEAHRNSAQGATRRTRPRPKGPRGTQDRGPRGTAEKDHRTTGPQEERRGTHGPRTLRPTGRRDHGPSGHEADKTRGQETQWET
jgi:hypothetical protein